MLAIIMSIENDNDRAFVEDIYNLYSEKDIEKRETA